MELAEQAALNLEPEPIEQDTLSCSFCSEDCPQSDATELDGNIYCPHCADRRLLSCECCREDYDWRLADSSIENYCSGCAEDHFICADCGDIYHTDEYGEDGYCINCDDRRREEYEEHTEFVHQYHSHDVLVNFQPDNTHTLYFGVELETDCYKERSAAAEELHTLSHEETLFYLSEDSSLNNGIEIITQPCTLNFHRSQFPWEKISEVVKRYGGKSHDTETCGLHIHFSKRFFSERDEALFQVRLVDLFQRFWQEFVIFSRRTGSAWRHYAARYEHSLHDLPAKRKVEDMKWQGNRYMAVNIQPTQTIEIRIFRGSLNIQSILASIELVDFLAHLVRVTSTKQIKSWDDIVSRVKRKSYTHLLPYLEEHHLTKESGYVPNNR